MLNSINSSQRKVRTEFFRLVVASLPATTPAQSSTGCPEGSFRCTVAKTATGVFVLNFNTPFSRIPVVTANALSASGKLFMVVSAAATTGITLKCFADDGTATDPTGVHITVIGSDTADQV